LGMHKGGDAGGDATVGNAKGGGLVGGTGDMHVNEDDCHPALGVDNNQETQVSGSGPVKMDITPENSKKPGAKNCPVTRPRKRPRISTRSANDSDESDESNSGTCKNPIDIDLYMSMWEHRTSKDFVSIPVRLL